MSTSIQPHVTPPKVVSLNVRPSQVSYLCFEVGGILGDCKAELGAPVVAFNFPGFYALLGSIPTIPDHPARMIYDFLEIQAFVSPSTLAALRAEGAKATLNKAINARANAFYAKYANGPAIISRINQDFSSKAARLSNLSNLSTKQTQDVGDAYVRDKRAGVLKTGVSSIASTTTGKSAENSADFAVNPGTFFAIPADETQVTFEGGNLVGYDDEKLGRTSSTSSETITNADYGYKHPFYELTAQYERAQISLLDEQLAQFLAGQNIPFLGAVFLNELNAINADVYRTQIAYLNTILMSPISGTVTGLYKNPGDAVRAGEPVIRVENNAEIFLVATLIYRGPISIGSTVTVTTTLFGLPGPKISTAGTAVAARGQRQDDRWEVIVKCNNLDAAGNAIFPLGYHFDYDDTTVSIT